MALKKSASSTVKKLYNKASQNYSAKLAGSKSLLYNKYVLYVAFVVCLLNLLLWLFSGEFVHVAIFLLVGYLTSYFSKNMIVILVIALVVSNVVKSGTNIVLEGMESKKDDSEDGVYHKKGEGMKGGKKEGMHKGKKEGMHKGKKEGMEDREGVDESHEGVDESHEGVDESHEGVDESHEGVDDVTVSGNKKGGACAIDKDCEEGYKCNDKYVCVAAK
jgi:hypothetical protein